MSASQRFRAIRISLVAGLVILALKIAAYTSTGSTALKSDALESIVNVLAAAFALAAILWANRPADRDHPYGHGKIEFFSAAFEGGLIALAALFIVSDALWTFYKGATVRDLGLGIILNSVAGIGNGLLGRYLTKVGRKTRSKALEADGLHVLSDFWTSAGLLVGLLVVKATGMVWLDPALALIMGLLLARTGFLVL